MEKSKVITLSAIGFLMFLQESVASKTDMEDQPPKKSRALQEQERSNFMKLHVGKSALNPGEKLEFKTTTFFDNVEFYTKPGDYKAYFKPKTSDMPFIQSSQ